MANARRSLGDALAMTPDKLAFIQGAQAAKEPQKKQLAEEPKAKAIVETPIALTEVVETEISDAASSEFIYVLGNKEDAREPIDRINSVLFRLWANLILSQPDGTKSRFWTFIDELSEAGYLSGLISFLKKARSKGGRCFVACQSIEGLKAESMYKEKPTADLLSCFGNRFITRLECPETAEYCSKYIGDQEILQSSHSNSSSDGKSQSSVSYSKVVQRTVLPSEFMSMPICGSENGLIALYKLRSSAPCWDKIAPDDLFNDWLIDSAGDVPEFIPRDAMSEYLNPWTPVQLAQFAPELSLSQRHQTKRNQTRDLGLPGTDIPDLDVN